VNRLHIALKKEQARNRRVIKKLLNGKRPKGLFEVIVPHAAQLLGVCGIDLELPSRGKHPLFFDRKTRRWWARNNLGRYYKITAKQAKTLLYMRGLKDCSSIELVFLALKTKRWGVSRALRLGGCEAGLHIIDGERVLVNPPLSKLDLEDV